MEAYFIGSFVLTAEEGKLGPIGGSLKIREAHSPEHSHDRGDMEIYGEYTDRNTWRGGRSSGALELISIGGEYDTGWSDYQELGKVIFRASNNWTGRTSSYGKENPDNYIPPYKVMAVWKRIS